MRLNYKKGTFGCLFFAGKVRMKKYLLMVFGIFIFLSYVVPNHYAPWVSFHHEVLAALAYAALVPLYWNYKNKFSFFQKSLIILSCLPIVQYEVGVVDYFGDAILGSLYILGFHLVYTMGVGARWSFSAKKKNEILSALFCGILFASIFSVGIALHQTLELQRFSVWLVETPSAVRAVGNLAQSNHLASLLFLGLVALLFFYINKKISIYTLMLGQFYLCMGLASAGSRTTFVILLFVLLLVLLYYFIHRISFFNVIWIMIFGFVFAYFLYYAFIDFFHMREARASADMLISGASGRIRMAYINIAWRAILDSPFLGYGMNQVVFLNEYVADGGNVTYTYFNSVHNLFLDVIVWFGFPVGLTVFFLLLREFKNAFYNGENELTFVLLLGVLVVFVHSMFEYPYRYSYFLLPMAFFMGYIRSFSKEVRPNKESSLTTVGGGFFATSLGVVLLVLVVVFEYFPYESEWSDLAYREAKIGSQVPKVLPNIYILTNLGALANAYRMNSSEYFQPEKIDFLKKVARHNPAGEILKRLAEAQFQQGDFIDYKKTIKIYCFTRWIENCSSTYMLDQSD